jgi:hypothetical protein
MAKAGLGIILSLTLTFPLAATAQKAGLAWQQLSAEQQRVLAPIQGTWDELDAQRKEKWIGIARRFPKMKPDAQARLQRRMSEWASLTPAQRQAAREKYREFEQLSPEERRAMREKWEKYRQAQAAKEAERKAEAEAKAKAAADAEAAGTPVESAAAAEPPAEAAPAGASSLRPQ